MSHATRLARPLRSSLRYSQREAVPAALMTGCYENYLAAFAIFLRATPQQIAWISAFPPLFGAAMQLIAVWVGSLGVPRMRLIIGGATFQALSILPLVVLALLGFDEAVTVLIVCAVLYQTGGNFVQPHWRALMGRLVPEKRRGRFFARRTRIATSTSFTALLVGGVMLHFADAHGMTWLGYTLLFAVAVGGRFASVRLLKKMSDPGHDPEAPGSPVLSGTLSGCWHALREPGFRRFMLFVALMQGAVAIAGPFFSVHMLRELHWSYLQFMANLAISVLVQFVTLNAWGHISDHLGNRPIMVFTSILIPLIPGLWMLSDNFWYLLAVQVLSGIGWGGFSLSTANYLYDLRPPGSQLATYAAVLALANGCAIFLGGMCGGYLASHLPVSISFGPWAFSWAYAMYGVFAISAVLRIVVAAWFLPHVAELRVTRTTSMGELIFRFARFNPISGVVMDIVGVTLEQRSRD